LAVLRTRHLSAGADRSAVDMEAESRSHGGVGARGDDDRIGEPSRCANTRVRRQFSDVGEEEQGAHRHAQSTCGKEANHPCGEGSGEHTPGEHRKHAIFLADVIRALEGPLAEVGGKRPEDTAYEGPAANLQHVWVAVRAALRLVLESTTLSDILSGELPPAVAQLLATPDAWPRRPTGTGTPGTTRARRPLVPPPCS
jgi:transcriptional regulator Rrf2-like protein